VITGPNAVPGSGRFAVLVDPAEAVFDVLELP
jgi:predicted enzyme related to lactoylglutathione lyase